MPTPTALPRGFWQQGGNSGGLLRAGGFGRRGYPGTGVRPSPGAVSGAFQPLPVDAGNKAWTWREAAEKWGWPGGGVLDWGSGFRLRSPALKSRPVARDRRCMTGAVGSVACHFFVSSSGRPVGREREGISSQSIPLEIPGRERWISAKSRPRDLFVDDSARFVDKSWSPAPAALAKTMRGGCCPSCVPATLSHLPFPTMNLALNSDPSGPDPRAGVAGHPLKPVSSGQPARRRVNAA